jgi:hypothetical protein
MSECPTCGRDDFKSEQGMKYHHSRTHGESLTEKELECASCGEIFTRPEYNIVEAENYYCSYECRKNTGEHDCPHENCDYTSDSKLGIQKHHKRTHGESLASKSVACDWCEDEITRPQSVIEQYDHNFCDKVCRTNWVSKNNSGEKHYDYSQKEVNCSNCGEKFTAPKNHRERSDNLFCSRDCYYEHLSDEVKGEDNFNWAGGYEPYYGESWHSQRQKAIDRDDEQCVDCGMTRDEHYDEYGADLEVHHKTPIRTFSDTEEANKLSNLVTVCTNCHQKREHS